MHSQIEILCLYFVSSDGNPIQLRVAERLLALLFPVDVARNHYFGNILYIRETRYRSYLIYFCVM